MLEKQPHWPGVTEGVALAVGVRHGADASLGLLHLALRRFARGGPSDPLRSSVAWHPVGNGASANVKHRRINTTDKRRPPLQLNLTPVTEEALGAPLEINGPVDAQRKSQLQKTLACFKFNCKMPNYQVQKPSAYFYHLERGCVCRLAWFIASALSPFFHLVHFVL